jgi:hypothetical protein
VSEPTAAVVIPFRDRGHDPYRQANLDRVLQWWRTSPWPVTVVDDGREGDAQFNRSAAYNLGAQLLDDDVDVIVYAESDMMLNQGAILSAIWMAAAQPGLVVPFTEYRDLSEGDSEKVRHGLDPAIFRPASTMEGGRSIGAINVVSRATLDAVGGYTELTEGSWYDDTIMGHAFEHCAGHTRWVDGPAFHLYHLPGWKGSHRTPADIAATKRNRDLWLKVRRLKDPAEIRALLHPVKEDHDGRLDA